MKPSSSLLLLVTVAYLFLFTDDMCFLIAEAVSQGDPQAFCRNYEKSATGGKPCPKIHKPVCGSDGQTYRNGCEFCKAAM
ncbi:serine protease inhibitor Kazal-type 12-like [Lycaon pictus]